MHKDNLINTLIANRAMTSREETKAFIEGMTELEQQSLTPDDLTKLLQVFSDQSRMPDVMWRLIHYVERFEMKEYIEALLHVTSDLTLTASGWLEEMYIRIALNDQAREILVNLLLSATKKDREAVCHVLSAIEENYSDINDRAEEIRQSVQGIC
jgi:hypothetical protein